MIAIEKTEPFKDIDTAKFVKFLSELIDENKLEAIRYAINGDYSEAHVCGIRVEEYAFIRELILDEDKRAEFDVDIMKN